LFARGLQSVRLPNRNWPLRITLNLPDWVGKVRGGRYLSTGSSRATLVYIRVGYLSSMESPSSSPMRRLNPSALALKIAASFRFCFSAGKEIHLRVSILSTETRELDTSSRRFPVSIVLSHGINDSQISP